MTKPPSFAGKIFSALGCCFLFLTAAAAQSSTASPVPLLPVSPQMQVFLIDDHLQLITNAIPGIVSYRILPPGAAQWQPPITLNGPPFTIPLASQDIADVGVYVPTGYTVNQAQATCEDAAQGKFPANNGSNYTPYSADLLRGETPPATPLQVIGSSGEDVCLVFMIAAQPDYHEEVEKVFPIGQYDEHAFSSVLASNVNPNVAFDLYSNNIDSTSQYADNPQLGVFAQLSATIGGMIQSLTLAPPTIKLPYQIINNLDIADSGLQWSAILRGVTLPNQTGPAMKELDYNQAVGADSSWMWGMEVPLVVSPTDPNSYATPGGAESSTRIWTPLYANINQDNREPQPSVPPAPPLFTPQSPLYNPPMLRLFDGRVDEATLATIPVSSTGQIARLSETFRSRSHLTSMFTAEQFLRFEWMSFARDQLLPYNAQIYFSDLNGNITWIGNLNGTANAGQTTLWTPGAGCTAMLPCGKYWPSTQVTSISIVLDAGKAPEQVVAIHLPNAVPFCVKVGFTSTDKSVTPNTNSTLLVVPYFATEGTPSTTPPTLISISPYFEAADTIQMSIGTDANLKLAYKGFGMPPAQPAPVPPSTTSPVICNAQ